LEYIIKWPVASPLERRQYLGAGSIIGDVAQRYRFLPNPEVTRNTSDSGFQILNLFQ